MATYTNRTLGEPATVKVIGERGSLTTTDSWGYGGDPSLLVLQLGDAVQVEYLGSSGWGGQIVGARRPGGPWLYRRSDEDVEADRAATLARIEQDRRDRLAANRDAWSAREAALPVWLRDRLATFHARGGETFETDGWGYELLVCELAALYAADADWVAAALPIDDGWERLRVPDPVPVAEVAEREGTSGNQHQVAQALALAHVRDPGRSLGGTVSALAPLTGDADYSGGRP